MPIHVSTETQLTTNPSKFAAHRNDNLLTPIKGEPPVNAGRGRRRNPLVTKMYNQLITSRNQWFHVNIPITSQKQLASLRTSLYVRARKDSMTISSVTAYNEDTKVFDLWVMLL